MKWVLLLLISSNCWAVIEDNSFLLEEAYNQEAGVQQFIQRIHQSEGAEALNYDLEHEVPLTHLRHQFSYALTYQHLDHEHMAAGDTTVSYRYQSLNTPEVVLAQRLGAILPTGSLAKETSNGVAGLEFMQAATLTLSPKWVNHWNLGFTTFSGAKLHNSAENATLTSTVTATSLIYLLREDLNLLLEFVSQSEQSLQPDGDTDTLTKTTINPGVRFAIERDWAQGTQIVPGIGLPLTIADGERDQGLLLYLSIEPKF